MIITRAINVRISFDAYVYIAYIKPRPLLQNLCVYPIHIGAMAASHCQNTTLWGKDPVATWMRRCLCEQLLARQGRTCLTSTDCGGSNSPWVAFLLLLLLLLLLCLRRPHRPCHCHCCPLQRRVGWSCRCHCRPR